MQDPKDASLSQERSPQWMMDKFYHMMADYSFVHVFQKNWTPEILYYNFAKIDLISIKIGTHNLHIM